MIALWVPSALTVRMPLAAGVDGVQVRVGTVALSACHVRAGDVFLLMNVLVLLHLLLGQGVRLQTR